jgi:hypothetical protein
MNDLMSQNRGMRTDKTPNYSNRHFNNFINRIAFESDKKIPLARHSREFYYFFISRRLNGNVNILFDAGD